MALIQIPFDPQQPDHVFSLELELVVYQFHFRLNARSNRWTMSILTEDGVLIAGGIPLVVSWPLTQRFRREELPPGEFYVLDLTGNNQEPGENSFGDTHALLYQESTDV